MYDNWAANLTVMFATVVTVALAVLVHYEGLIVLSRRIQHLHGRQRIKVLYAILTVLALHVGEIWLFGAVLWLLLQWPDCGFVALSAHAGGQTGFFDAVYLSAITFTTVGFGDLAPVGPIRFLSGTEALTGFVLITWSASFTFLEMERYWRNP
jgi:Ion channel